MLGLLDVKYDNMISLFLEDIPVIPDLEDVQEEDMMTQIAAPPRCVIDMFHLEPFSISGVLGEKISLKHQLMPSRRSCPEDFENGIFTLKTKQMLSVHTVPQDFKTQKNHRPFWICV